jgi:hypothetical protein
LLTMFHVKHPVHAVSIAPGPACLPAPARRPSTTDGRFTCTAPPRVWVCCCRRAVSGYSRLVHRRSGQRHRDPVASRELPEQGLPRTGVGATSGSAPLRRGGRGVDIDRDAVRPPRQCPGPDRLSLAGALMFHVKHPRDPGGRSPVASADVEPVASRAWPDHGAPRLPVRAALEQFTVPC